MSVRAIGGRLASLTRLKAVTGDGLGKRLATGVGWTATGSVVASAATLLVSVAVARLLGPAQYGEFGALQSTLGTLGLFVAPSLGLTATKYLAELRASD